MGIRNSFFEWMFLWHLKGDKSKALRITGSNSMKHPTGDIDFAKIEKRFILLALNEMSLQGADSPLPDNFLRGVRTENENSVVLAAFLNMLQHYLAMFRFNAILEKSNFLMQALGNKKWQTRFDLYNENYSQEMLRCFFVKMFPEAQISVHCFEPLRIENPAPFVLGKSKLDGEYLLGENCITFSRAMRINICEAREELPNINIKFPFKIKLVFETKASNKLSENFCLGTNNLKPSKWEKWI
jgi:predicted component of type VI protein secretion system